MSDVFASVQRYLDQYYPDSKLRASIKEEVVVSFEGGYSKDVPTFGNRVLFLGRSTMNSDMKHSSDDKLSVSDSEHLDAIRDCKFSYFVNNFFSEGISGGQYASAISGHPSGDIANCDT